MNDDAKTPMAEKPILRDLNIIREILVETQTRIDKFNNLIDRISHVDVSSKGQLKDSLSKEISWDESNLEQKIGFNKNLADNNLVRLREVGDRLNSLI
jgi:hypothetical protein